MSAYRDLVVMSQSLVNVRRGMFGPVSRDGVEALSEQAAKVLAHPFISTVLETLGGHVFLLNANNQIVATSTTTLAAGLRNNGACHIGQRLGEWLNCVHHHDSPLGCGTGEACRSCGAALAILASQVKGDQKTNDCVITMNEHGQTVSTDFRVHVRPISIQGTTYSLCTLQDISDEKRAAILNSLFMHDMGNLLTGLSGWSELLEGGIDADDAAKEIVRIVHRLNDQFSFHRDLIEAEKGELRTALKPLAPSHIVDDLMHILRPFAESVGVQIRAEFEESGEQIVTDPTILSRVLVNMIKNAIEASGPGEVVTVHYCCADGHPTFDVHNDSVIPERMQPRIFERSYSTKRTTGRGLGTYSMKLFGERYLKGTVAFRSNADDGTTFWFALPPDSVVTAAT